jgi:RimJ/RimL family protein N-acetyltransferase
MINGSKIKLRAKRLSDAREDYTWHTDHELARLDAASVSTTTFPQYLAEYASELRYPSPLRNRFAIETLEGEHIGNCTYYGIDPAKGEAELGIMIGNHGYWDQGYGADAVATLVNHIFQETKLNRIYLKTLDSNTRAHRCFQKCGFTAYGELKRDGYSFVLMELTRQEWQKRQP